MCIRDSYGALYIGKMAYELAGEELPEPWKELAEKRIHSCHFEFPGSTHSMQIRVDSVTDEKDPITRACSVCNTDESAPVSYTHLITFDNITFMGKKCETWQDLRLVTELANDIYVNGVRTCKQMKF